MIFKMLYKMILPIPVVVFICLAHLHQCNAAITIHAIPPVGDHEYSRAYGINDNGIVCGKSYSTDIDDIAITWSFKTGSNELPSIHPNSESSAWDINNRGQISGFSRSADGAKHGIRWEKNHSPTDLGTLANPHTTIAGRESEGYGISSSGIVLGYAQMPNIDGTLSPFHATVFDDTTTNDLGTLNTSNPEYQYGYSIAYNTNINGKSVGIAHNNELRFRPFIHDSINGMTELPIDEAHADGEWYAVAINTSGMISGHIIAHDGSTKPYYWPSSNSAPIPISMPSTFPNGEIYAMNNYGQMVGMMWQDSSNTQERAFIFDPLFGIRDLNTFLPANSGWTLSFARDINDTGQIVGGGIYEEKQLGFMLNSLNLYLPGDFTNNGTVNLEDAVLLMQIFTSQNPTAVNRFADIDGDGKAGMADTIYTLQRIANQQD